jgi:enoyl-CoA hydratase
MSEAENLTAANEPSAGQYKCFDVSFEGKVAHLQLKRPEKMNSMIREFWYELPEIIHDIDNNARARAIVISSTGKHFCAGMDLSVFSGIGEGGDDSLINTDRTMARRLQMFQNLPELQHTFACMDECRIPVLMAVQGACIGGAVDFSCSADMRYCTKDAFFCIQEINIGMTADVGTFPRLPHLMPQGLVRELAYTGRRMLADEALRVGFINQVFDTQEEMLEHVLGLAKTITEKSPLAVWGSKEMINYGRDHTIADGLKHIMTWQAGMFSPAEMKESFTAQAEKRIPNFDDLPKKNKPI